ncbi:MAG TPA: sensor histidine kinase [Chloroflexota bacterium]|nr:sensor histidine kinase [Chloroflexota bacterium]
MRASADDRNLLRLAGIALPAAVWVLCIVPPPRGGLTPEYLATLTGLLALLVLVDQTLPSAAAPAWRRLVWLGAELLLGALVVQTHATLVRPALIYLLPVSRALLLFPGRGGLLLSGLVWAAYALNVALVSAWPDRLYEIPNYLTFFLGPYVVAVILTAALLRQMRLYEELRALHQQARQAAVTEERNRLAREIHDSVAHYLTVISVQLEAADKLLRDATGGPARSGRTERAVDHLRRARRLTVECLQEARRSVAALRASSLEQLSLPRALDRLVVEFAESTGIAVDLDVGLADGERIEPETALALYRAAQEGLTNVQRHAQAGSARVSLQRRNGHLELAVEDDGVGPAPANGDHGGPVRPPEGFGLLGLRERVELLGGQLAFGPCPPGRGGSRLAVSVPVVEPS